MSRLNLVFNFSVITTTSKFDFYPNCTFFTCQGEVKNDKMVGGGGCINRERGNHSNILTRGGGQLFKGGGQEFIDGLLKGGGRG